MLGTRKALFALAGAVALVAASASGVLADSAWIIASTPFEAREPAAALADALGQRGFQAEVQTGPQAGRFRVAVLGFQTRDDAQQTLDSLIDAGFHGFRVESASEPGSEAADRGLEPSPPGPDHGLIAPGNDEPLFELEARSIEPRQPEPADKPGSPGFEILHTPDRPPEPRQPATPPADPDPEPEPVAPAPAPAPAAPAPDRTRDAPMDDREVLGRLHQMSANLRTRGFPVFVRGGAGDTRDLMLVAEFKAREHAADMEAELRSYGYKTMVFDMSMNDEVLYQVFVDQALAPDVEIAEAPPRAADPRPEPPEPRPLAAEPARPDPTPAPGASRDRRLIIQVAVATDFETAEAAARMLARRGIDAGVLDAFFQGDRVYPVVANPPEDRDRMRLLVAELADMGFAPRVLDARTYGDAHETRFAGRHATREYADEKTGKPPPPDPDTPKGYESPLDLFM